MRRTSAPILPLLLPLALGAAEATPPTAPPPPEPEIAPPAATTVDQPLVLDAEAAAELARANADRVLAARAGSAATRAEGRARLGALLPQLRADAGYTYWEDSAPPVGGGGDISFDDEHDQFAAEARLEQLLWSFGRMAGTLEARDALGRIAGADERLAERDAAYRARRAVAEVRLAAARLEVATKRVEQRESELADAEDRLAVGAVTELDVNEARIVLINARDQRRAAAAAVARAYHELENALALQAPQLQVAGELERPGDLATLLAAAEANLVEGPEIAGLRAQAALRAADREVERGRALPELSAYGAWRSEGHELDDQEDQWRVGLELSWSLYDGGSTWARAEAARHDRLRLMRLSDAEARERLRQFEDVRSDLAILAERIAEAEVAVELATANYEDARDRYREGVIDRVRLGEANLQITLARLTLIDLVYQEVVAGYLLKRLAE